MSKGIEGRGETGDSFGHFNVNGSAPLLPPFRRPAESEGYPAPPRPPVIPRMSVGSDAGGSVGPERGNPGTPIGGEVGGTPRDSGTVPSVGGEGFKDSTPLLSAARAVEHINPDIDVPRLLADLGITEGELRRMDALDIPPDIAVASKSTIKTSTGADVLRIVQSGREFDVVGESASSGVEEQPIGQAAIDGALNRLHNLGLSDRVGPNTARLAIENGLFRTGSHPTIYPTDRSREGVVQFTEEADLTVPYDPAAHYEDRAVVAISIPGHPTVVQISPTSEAVAFPQEAVQAAHDAEGGFLKNTAGAMLKEMDIVADKQNPHKELTVDRADGPLPRQDQMARAMIRGLLTLATGALERGDGPSINSPATREPQYPGGRMEESSAGSGYIEEQYEQREDKTALLANGTRVTLPYTEYQKRVITPGDSELHDTQHDVAYDSLSEAEKAAVAVAMDAQDRAAYRTETFPEYQRLALREGEEGTPDAVHTVVFRDSLNRVMSTYPDSHTFTTSETDSSLDRQVEIAEPIRDGFLVTPYNLRYMSQATYRDPDPNLFGPQDEFANAFWISGNPRTILSDDPRLMQEVDGSIPQPRFVIVPVRFYKVIQKNIADSERDVVL